jgi:hypothetical protein
MGRGSESCGGGVPKNGHRAADFGGGPEVGLDAGRGGSAGAWAGVDVRDTENMRRSSERGFVLTGGFLGLVCDAPSARLTH